MKKVLVLLCLLAVGAVAAQYFKVVNFKKILISKDFEVAEQTAAPTESVEKSPEKRLALVIGNADYTDDEHWQDIFSDEKDAEDIAKVLEGFGFEVMLKINLNHKDMHNALIEFSNKLDKNTAGLVYYSGHGVQVEGRQYLVPVDADAKDIPADSKKADESLLSNLLFNVNTDVLARIEDKARVSMLILDACRSSLFLEERDRERMRKGGEKLVKGLSKIRDEDAKGTLIVSSTASGESAIGAKEGENSVYTAHLLKFLREKPTDEVRLLLGDVTDSVMLATNNKQVPWSSGSIRGRFYFQPPKIDNEEQQRIEVEKLALDVEKKKLAAQQADPLANQQTDKLATVQAEKSEIEAENKRQAEKLAAFEEEKKQQQMAQAQQKQDAEQLAETERQNALEKNQQAAKLRLQAKGMVSRGEGYTKKRNFKAACDLFEQAAALGNKDGQHYVDSKLCKKLI